MPGKVSSCIGRFIHHASKSCKYDFVNLSTPFALRNVHGRATGNALMYAANLTAPGEACTPAMLIRLSESNDVTRKI